MAQALEGGTGSSGTLIVLHQNMIKSCHRFLYELVQDMKRFCGEGGVGGG